MDINTHTNIYIYFTYTNREPQVNSKLNTNINYAAVTLFSIRSPSMC